MTEPTSLHKKLENYGASDAYPYHMPGHKRKQLGEMPGQLLKTDITEIDGFDNLHDSREILQTLQDTANALYHAGETFYMVNGSTGGILSAISAALPENGHLLMTRNCHRSVYHAAYLRHLRLSYLYPREVSGFHICEAVLPEQVESMLREKPDVDAVCIVSPTYEGRIADVKSIAEIVHAKGIPLIVDEAHGAHLGFAEGFVPGSCTQGADIVIHSVHKTLPAMTQTALLHVNGDRIDRDRLRRFLRIYQTSSPSYVLMASICDAMEIMKKDGIRRLHTFRQAYEEMLKSLEKCRVLRFLPGTDMACGRQDVGKLVIATDVKIAKEAAGKWLYDTLREKYHLQCEMAAGDYCLAMFTLADDEEAYRRMEQALLEIDEYLSGAAETLHSGTKSGGNIADFSKERPAVKYSLSEAWNMPGEWRRLTEASGCAAGEFVNLYPPGIPILVPGEILTDRICEQLSSLRESGLDIQGISQPEDEQNKESYIKVLL